MRTTYKRGLLVLFLIALSACSNTSDTVNITSGALTGVTEGEVTYYRGIPYAHPPIGNSRWRAPEAIDPWQGTLVADSYGPGCWQDLEGGNDIFLKRLLEGSGMSALKRWAVSTFAGFVSTDISEDCLTLNVMVPKGKQKQSLPVMFWIHGGGHQFGSGGVAYESPSLVGKDVVLVTINYRLGLYGFFAHEDLQKEDPNASTGNYGMLDQLFALQWVQDNIAKFGGDPKNVTIFGESAGGHSVGQLMASPLSQDLFHKAIAQSGTGFQQFQATAADHDQISGLKAGKQLLACSGVKTIDELRQLDPEALRWLATHPEMSNTYHPQIDGHVLEQSTAETFRNGKQMKVPLIVGSNANEGSLLYGFGLNAIDGMTADAPLTQADWQALLKKGFADNAQDLAEIYGVDTHAEVPGAAAELMGDARFGRHAFYMAEFHSEKVENTFLYFYERTPPAEGQTIGAAHALELNHVFGPLIPGWPSDDRDQQLAHEMQSHWAKFAETGNPNAKNSLEWTPFDPSSPVEMAYGHDRSNSRSVDREKRYKAMHAQFINRVPAVKDEVSTAASTTAE
ncbi:MAG: para-nitrobenzyl esterase [Limisphaerales bacterium]